MEEKRGSRKIRYGTVVSNKMDKTVVVAVQTVLQHPLYKRTIRRTTKFKAHDPENKCEIGDRVKVASTRPLSKDKRWRIVEITKKAD